MNDSKCVRKGFVADHIKSLPKSGIRRFFDLVNTMDDVISLGVGEPDFVTPWTIRETGIFSLEKGHTSYTSNLGTPALRREVCRYVRDNYHVSYRPEDECIITIGVSEALDIAMRALLDPGDEVLYTEPCFVSYPAEVRMAHGIPVPIETKVEDAFALDPAVLRRKITPRTKVLLLNFPCNPTGAVMPLESLKEVAAIAMEHDLVVITDEIYSELLYEGEHVSIASLPGMRDRTLFLHGFSKAFAMTGWRVGYACGPREIIDAMMKVHQYAIMCASTMAQEAALEALRNGEKEMLRMRESYCERRNLMVDGLNRIGLDCLLPKGAFYTFPSVKSTGLSSTEFAEQLLKAEKVAVVPGVAFGACGEGFVRCCYATSASDLIEAIDRMGRFVQSLKH
ncbi:aminotransferase class I/II-fold pyridoxal phosphate-dependent enzyme [Victivallaceae bacterium BBE-744-WT-12]|jgi:aminotransferase class I and II|uniref:Aminotransferase n=2 Tax=Victivallis lenta TaxID=2606640 RepID=A0A844FZH3_9BACT|nr:aromatic amino acid aminotransferase [Victivallales bacterium CCUG 44730]MBS5529670.1 aminotransferase class I/II-fold pyridoxal phosphate-dependent enzyme [bacterium]MST96313.1 aminotransferase class I/II-fold pyridoxal phosphate-dependent enzyme [Victivallis lenta]HBP05482.1 aminotransferase class V-fold PLP-dependent enzyme [Lentisphaeria bacterium]HCH85529.1 aminotransferase class V-fold PLP-dependent enzyme [Lentisphaeria bacterium]